MKLNLPGAALGGLVGIVAARHFSPPHPGKSPTVATLLGLGVGGFLGGEIGARIAPKSDWTVSPAKQLAQLRNRGRRALRSGG